MRTAVRRGSSSPGSSKSTAGNLVAWHISPSAGHRYPPPSAADHEEHPMPGWNFADVWEVMAEQIPDAPAQVHGDRHITWAEFDRRANGVAAPCSTGARSSRTRWLSTSTTAPSTSSRCSPRSRPASSPSTPTTATRTTSSSTCGTTPTAWPWCSTAPSPTPSSASATGCLASPPGCGSTTATGCAPSGPPPTSRRPTATTTSGSWPPGAAAATTSS